MTCYNFYGAGTEQEEGEELKEVAPGLMLAPHSLLHHPALSSLLSSHRVTNLLEASLSPSLTALPPGVTYTHLPLAPWPSTFSSVTKEGGARLLLVCSEGLATGALLCAARLVRTRGLSVERALAMVEEAGVTCSPPPALRLQLEDWARPPAPFLLLSWLPGLVLLLLLGLAWRQLTLHLEEEHQSDVGEESLRPYSYFQILKWP